MTYFPTGDLNIYKFVGYVLEKLVGIIWNRLIFVTYMIDPSMPKDAHLIVEGDLCFQGKNEQATTLYLLALYLCQIYKKTSV